jgi:shikimate dehydrogenase
LIRLAVFGRPVAQSLSPRIHALFAAQFELAVEYTAIEPEPDAFEDEVRRFAAGSALGCNVTLPFKQRAWRLAGRPSEAADLAQAANTLTFDAAGWRADNTDGGGLVRALEEHEGCPLHGRRVALLGAGGAAAGVLSALLRAGADSVTIANRTVERAERLAARHADLGRVAACSPQALAGQAPFELVVNATSGGHGGAAPTLSAGLFAPGALCYDMNYGAAAQPLALRCRELGLRYADGLSMLVGQAALAFGIWTGKAPSTNPVLEALRGAARE